MDHVQKCGDVKADNVIKTIPSSYLGFRR